MDKPNNISLKWTNPPSHLGRPACLLRSYPRPRLPPRVEQEWRLLQVAIKAPSAKPQYELAGLCKPQYALQSLARALTSAELQLPTQRERGQKGNKTKWHSKLGA